MHVRPSLSWVGLADDHVAIMLKLPIVRWCQRELDGVGVGLADSPETLHCGGRGPKAGGRQESDGEESPMSEKPSAVEARVRQNGRQADLVRTGQQGAFQGAFVITHSCLSLL